VDSTKSAESKNKRVISFLCSLPCWWIGLKGIESALLRSKEPKWFELYSNEKLLFLLGTISACFFWIKFAHPRLCSFLQKKSKGMERLNPFALFLILASTTTFFNLKQGMRVGEDVTGQVFSSLQYCEGRTTFANYCSMPNPLDLSQNQSNWSPRPPGASWIALPGLFLGLSIGDSLRLSLFLFFAGGGVGWLKLSKQFALSSESLQLLALLLGLGVGSATTFFGTMNCALYFLVPWMILWAVSLGRKMYEKDLSFLVLISCLLGFSLCLGFFSVLKLSGMIAALTIVSIPIFYIFFSDKIIINKFLKIICCSASVLIVFGSYQLLENFNERERGHSSDDMYREIDYNQQSLLWGNYFVESTRGVMLGWSTLGSPGYALPGKKLAHGGRDLANQFVSFREWMDEKKVNPHALICGTVGFLFTLFLGFNFWKVRTSMNDEFKITSLIFLIIPFVGLSAVSYLHGFNYSLYSSHTFEYALMLTLPVCHSLFQNRNTNNYAVILLSGICFALPISTQAESLIRLPLQVNQFVPSTTEQDRGFAAREFSNAISLIESKSNHESDILLFLPSGDLGDLYLRTRLHCLGLHFAGGNLPKAEPFETSKPLNVYCAYSAILQNDSEFQAALNKSFPQADSILELSTNDDKNVIVLKIALDPDSEENE